MANTPTGPSTVESDILKAKGEWATVKAWLSTEWKHVAYVLMGAYAVIKHLV